MANDPVTPRSLGDRDAPHSSPVTPAEDARTVLINKVSLGAVFAGIVMALVVHLILNMLGSGIGILSLDPATGDNPDPGTFSIVAGVWWTVSGIIAAFAGGFTAGRLSGKPKESTTGWHGLAAWAGATLVVVYLLTTAAAGLVGGILSAVGGVAQTAAQVAGPALAEADPFAAIERQVRRATAGGDPAALRDAAVAGVRAAFTADEAEAAQARQEAIQALTAAGVPADQAQAQLDQFQQQYRAAVDEAAQAAQAAADAAGTAALFAAIGLILGAAAAWFGGRSGAVHPTITSAFLARTQRPL